MITNRPYMTISHATIVDPTGVPDRMDMIMPVRVQRTDRTAEQTVTLLKLLNTLIDDIAGNMTRADMRSDPTRFIARTIIVAIIIAMKMLYKRADVPDVLAKASSKVTAKILL